MKKAKILMMIALCGSSLSPAMMTPAFAITPSGTTEAAMAARCATDLGALGGGSLRDGTPVYSTVVVELGSVNGPTTEVPNSRVIDPASVVGAGIFTLSANTIEGEPYRVGGSVNMFGKEVSGRKDWSKSEYNFTADYSTTTTFSYKCEVSQATETYYPGTPPTPVQGYYINCDFGNGQGNDNSSSCEEVGQPQGACAAYNGTGSSLPFWGTDKEQCKFIKTGDGDPGEPAYWETDPDLTPRPDLSTQHTVDETNIAEDVPGRELNGGPVFELGRFIGQAVICISPSKTVKGGVPGAWQTQNGYTGSNCTTAWFNAAPWGAGSETSQGTYISVPAV
ncbi:hypothetical protein [Sphingorhabdus sp.]|uniref:hypothetical protein n=1 Tax=Sphingorhabdus sp. TaxID=1902408 RepID=UPI00391D08F5